MSLGLALLVEGGLRVDFEEDIEVDAQDDEFGLDAADAFIVQGAATVADPLQIIQQLKGAFGQVWELLDRCLLMPMLSDHMIQPGVQLRQRGGGRFVAGKHVGGFDRRVDTHGASEVWQDKVTNRWPS